MCWGEGRGEVREKERERGCAVKELGKLVRGRDIEMNRGWERKVGTSERGVGVDARWKCLGIDFSEHITILSLKLPRITSSTQS